MTKRLTCGDCLWGRPIAGEFCQMVLCMNDDLDYHPDATECDVRYYFRRMRDEVAALSKLADEQHEIIKECQEVIDMLGGGGKC